jgi:2-dehydro-3-deoxygluconokinase
VIQVSQSPKGSSAPEVVTFGESMIVLNPSVAGPMRYVHTFHRSLAGAESNLAIGMARLGRSCGWFSRVGDDEFGRYATSTLRGEQVDVSRVMVDGEAPTGIYFKELRAAGDPAVYYYRRGSAASRLSPDDLDLDYIRQARLLHITGITPALSQSCRLTVMAAIEAAGDAGVPISFDPNYRSRLWSREEAGTVFRDIARRVDILLPGRSEVDLVLPLSRPTGNPAVALTTPASPAVALAQALLETGPSLVVLKLGPEGAAFAQRDATGQVHAETMAGFPLPAVDSIGAGDAFDAAFLDGWLGGRDIAAAVKRACAAGALATQVIGDWEGMPDEAALESFIAGRTAETR